MHSCFFDSHMHSSFSVDSEAPMEEMILQAAAAGHPGICFTEHLDPDYPETPDGADYSKLDLLSYRGTLTFLREKYAGMIRVNYGIELGLQPHLAGQFASLTESEPFDFVIGSSHVLDGEDPYYPSYYENRREEDVYRRYFEYELENIRAFPKFDVYGHLDYIVRYGPQKNRNFSYEAYQDVIDPVLRELVSRGIGLEINTGGLSNGLGTTNPCPDILKRYRALGGEIITTGSDAHRPEDIGRHFDLARDILLDCGFRYCTVFEERRPVFIPIS